VGPGQYLKIETTARYGGSAVTADRTQVSWQENRRPGVCSADRTVNGSEPRRRPRRVLKRRAVGSNEAAGKTPSDMVGIQRAPRGAFHGVSKPSSSAACPWTKQRTCPAIRRLSWTSSMSGQKRRQVPEIKALGTITCPARRLSPPTFAAFYRRRAYPRRHRRGQAGNNRRKDWHRHRHPVPGWRIQARNHHRSDHGLMIETKRPAEGLSGLPRRNCHDLDLRTDVRGGHRALSS
jgi:hypothetical protein